MACRVFLRTTTGSTSYQMSSSPLNIEEILVTDPLYDIALELRYKLFFKEFDLPKSVTTDELEPVSFHVAISKGLDLLAYGRLSPLEPGIFRISQIVVPEDQRRKGYASCLVDKLIDLAKTKGARTIRLNSQTSTKDLYQRIGFREVSDVYKVKLTDVEHIKMAFEIVPS